MQKVIILRGCMASGKSTIAQKYRSFSKEMAWIKVDRFKDLFDHVEKEARPIVHGAANATLDYLLSVGFSAVVEGVFQDPIFVKQAVEVASKHNVVCRVFQLQVPLQVLQARDKVREGVQEGWRQPLGDAEIATIYSKIENNPYLGAIELNTDKLSLEKAIAFIEKEFDNEPKT